MNRKKVRKTFDLELLGGVAALLLIVCTVAAFLDMENAPGFFVLISGMGILVNGVLAGLKFIKRRYVSAAVLMILTVVLLVLFAIQFITVEGLL
jgi:hypothetical protein